MSDKVTIMKCIKFSGGHWVSVRYPATFNKDARLTALCSMLSVTTQQYYNGVSFVNLNIAGNIIIETLCVTDSDLAVTCKLMIGI